MRGGLCANGDSFDDAARVITEKVFLANGFSVKSVSKVPYLCRGDLSQPYYVLHDALFTLEVDKINK